MKQIDWADLEQKYSAAQRFDDAGESAIACVLYRIIIGKLASRRSTPLDQRIQRVDAACNSRHEQLHASFVAELNRGAVVPVRAG